MDSERYKKGMELMRAHLGPMADQYVDKINAISEIFGRVNVEFPFGEIDLLVEKKKTLTVTR